jgi:hypothetical protein
VVAVSLHCPTTNRERLATNATNWNRRRGHPSTSAGATDNPKGIEFGWLSRPVEVTSWHYFKAAAPIVSTIGRDGC